MNASDQSTFSQAGQLSRDVVVELRELAKRNPPAREFFGLFFERLENPLGFVAAAAWLIDESGRLRPVCHLDLFLVGDLEDAEHAAPHYRLLQEVLATEEASVEPRGSLAGEATAANPTDCLVWMLPLHVGEEAVGVVEFFFRREGSRNGHGRPPGSPQVREIAEEYLTNRSDCQGRASVAAWTELEEFARTAHQSLRLTDTAYTIANEARRILECDRVSVAVWRDGRCRLEAISGQDVFDRRTRFVRQLQELTARVIKYAEPLSYRGEPGNLPPQLEAALDGFLDESHARFVLVLPLARPLTREEAKGKRTSLPPVGALVIEQLRDVPAKPGFERRAELVRQTSAQALAHAVDHDGAFLAPVLRWLGKLWLLRSRPWAKLTAAGVIALGLVMAFVPAVFELEGRGTLEPVGRHDVFAAVDGVVDQVLVEHGDLVEPGQVVAQLRNTDVAVKLAELQGELLSASAALRRVNTTLLNGRAAGAELERLHGERGQWIAKQDSLKQQLALYQRKAAQLTARTPVAGQIVTWDLRNTLIHRPVERGQMLASVADVNGEWELQIHMPEDRMGHITRAQAQLGQKLPVKLILATTPGVTYQGTLQEVHQRAEVRGEEGNVVLLRVAIDKRQLSQLRRGATVLARVNCGRRSLGYVWFHDLWEFVQSRLLFRL